jgi:hypothetical protein
MHYAEVLIPQKTGGASDERCKIAKFGPGGPGDTSPLESAEIDILGRTSD